MRRALVAAVTTIASALAVPTFADCPSLTSGHTTSQLQGPSTLYVEGVTQVRVFCFIEPCCYYSAQSETWVEGLPYNLKVNYDPGGAYGARAVASNLVPAPPGLWTTRSKHWEIQNNSTWIEHERPDGTSDTEYVAAGGGEEEDDPIEDGCEPTPIIIDVAGNGYRLTSAADGVLFDTEANGSQHMVSWTTPNSDDAWLAIDRNNNGRIDDSSELFGDHTPAYPDDAALRHVETADGFQALWLTEKTGRTDRIIDSHDSIWSRLLLWTDRNHNGFSEPDELTPVANSTLKAIETTAHESRRRDVHGNEFRLRATAYFARPARPGDVGNPGAGPIDNPRTAPGLIPRFVYDVWLKTQ